MRDGATALMGCFMVLVILVLIVVVVLNGVGSFMDNRTTQLRAEESLERARTDREKQQSINWQHEFQLYSITLKSFANDSTVLLCIISGITGVLVFALGVVLVELYWKK